MRKTIWRVGVLLLVVLLCCAALLNGEGGRRRRTAVLLAIRGEALARTAEAALAGEPVKNRDLWGVRTYNVWPSEADPSVRMVDLPIGGWGLGSSTGYWGLYTTTNGDAAGFQGANMPLNREGKGYRWEEPAGDNSYYTEELSPGWWYYQMTF